MMAADRRVTDTNQRYTVCKIKRIGNAIVGCAGDSPASNKFMRWYASGADPDNIPKMQKDDELEAIAITPEGMFLYDINFIPDQLEDPFYAVGSGGQAALAAMHMFGDLEFAIELASMIDNHTGDGVDILSL